MARRADVAVSITIVVFCSILLLLFMMLVCGSAARAEDRALATLCGSGDAYAQARVLRNSKLRFETGDLLLMAFHFPPWSMSDALYRITESFTDIPFTHAGIVIRDADGALMGVPDMCYAFEFDLNASGPRLRPLASRLRKFLPNRVVVRRAVDPCVDHEPLFEHVRRSGACADADKFRKRNEARRRQHGSMRDGVVFLSRMVRRYVLDQCTRDKVGNPTNCVDTAIDALIASGQWRGDPPTLPMHPSKLLHGEIASMRLEPPEMLVGLPEWQLLLDADAMQVREAPPSENCDDL